MVLKHVSFRNGKLLMVFTISLICISNSAHASSQPNLSDTPSKQLKDNVALHGYLGGSSRSDLLARDEPPDSPPFSPAPYSDPYSTEPPLEGPPSPENSTTPILEPPTPPFTHTPDSGSADPDSGSDDSDTSWALIVAAVITVLGGILVALLNPQFISGIFHLIFSGSGDRRIAVIVQDGTTSKRIRRASVGLVTSEISLIRSTDAQGVTYFPRGRSVKTIKLRVEARGYAIFERNVDVDAFQDLIEIRLSPTS